jgi:biotin carboxyl carrier protein
MMPRRATAVWIELGGRLRKVVLGGAAGASVTVDGQAFAVDARELAPGMLSLLLTLPDGTTRSYRCVAENTAGESAVVIESQRFAYSVADPRSLQAVAGGTSGGAGPRPLKSPMPGRILRVLVAVGDVVEAGQGCLVIEAMKMQNELKAPKAGRIAGLAVKVGETVVAGTVLLVVE